MLGVPNAPSLCMRPYLPIRWRFVFPVLLGIDSLFCPSHPHGNLRPRRESLDFPTLENEDIVSIANFWLTESEARIHLNEQLGQLLRCMIEALRDDYKFQGDHPFNWCPICGAALVKYDQPGI